MTYLLDTDTVNYILKNIAPGAGRFDAALDAQSIFILCPVVHYEVLRHLRLKGAKRQLALYEGLIINWLPVELVRSAG